MASRTPSMTPQEFVDKWRRSHLKERSASQEHFIDLCRMLGHPTPAQADPEGASGAELKKRTLTNLYNQRPTWLDLAHKKLHEAVLDAYAWPHHLTDDQILERLLALNLERAEEGDRQRGLK